jgi:hypothetical protein
LSKPLIPNPKRRDEASKFHATVFSKWGHKCYKCNGRATDAAHVISRARLGPHRYAAASINGRPLCRSCHEGQEAGLWDFPEFVKKKAIAALNRICKIPLT